MKKNNASQLTLKTLAAALLLVTAACASKKKSEDGMAKSCSAKMEDRQPSGKMEKDGRHGRKKKSHKKVH